MFCHAAQMSSSCCAQSHMMFTHCRQPHTRFHAVVQKCTWHLSHQLTCAFHPHGIYEQCHERVKNMTWSDTLCVGAHADCHMRRLDPRHLVESMIWSKQWLWIKWWPRVVCSQKRPVSQRLSTSWSTQSCGPNNWLNAMVVNQMVAVCCVFKQTAMVVCQMLCAKCCRQSVVTVSVRMRHREPPKGRSYTEPLSARGFGLDAISRRKYNFVPCLRTHTDSHAREKSC